MGNYYGKKELTSEEKEIKKGKFGYTVQLNGVGVIDREREKLWDEKEVTRFNGHILRNVYKQPICFSESIASDSSYMYISRDYHATHLCIIEKKMESALLVSLLCPYYKIVLGRKGNYVAYGIIKAEFDVYPCFLCFIENAYLLEEEEEEEERMDHYKMSIQLTKKDTDDPFGMKFFDQLEKFRYLSNTHKILFRNYAQKGDKATVDLYSNRGVIDKFVNFVRLSVEDIIYE